MNTQDWFPLGWTGWISLQKGRSIQLFYVLCLLPAQCMPSLGVNWNLERIHIQSLLCNKMIFWWICGGESGLPILFLLHLGSVPSFTCLFNITVNILGVITNFCIHICKEIQPVHPKGDQSWVFIGRNDVEAETPILWPPDAKSWLIWKVPDAGKDWGQKKRTTEDEMVG